MYFMFPSSSMSPYNFKIKGVEPHTAVALGGGQVAVVGTIPLAKVPATLTGARAACGRVKIAVIVLVAATTLFTVTVSSLSPVSITSCSFGNIPVAWFTTADAKIGGLAGAANAALNVTGVAGLGREIFPACPISC
jgi:hypothetical protein